jgi:hypothetical protein
MRVVIVLTCLLVSQMAWAQEGGVLLKVGPYIEFADAEYDFGDISQGDKVKHTFDFKNSGTEPLILSNVLVTCGCTATDWPKQPIMPGESKELTVSFDSTGKVGRQNKVITIVSNASNSQERVKIVTNILPKGSFNKL